MRIAEGDAVGLGAFKKQVVERRHRDDGEGQAGGDNRRAGRKHRVRAGFGVIVEITRLRRVATAAADAPVHADAAVGLRLAGTDGDGETNDLALGNRARRRHNAERLPRQHRDGDRVKRTSQCAGVGYRQAEIQRLHLRRRIKTRDSGVGGIQRHAAGDRRGGGAVGAHLLPPVLQLAGVAGAARIEAGAAVQHDRAVNAHLAVGAGGGHRHGVVAVNNRYIARRASLAAVVHRHHAVAVGCAAAGCRMGRRRESGYAGGCYIRLKRGAEKAGGVVGAPFVMPVVQQVNGHRGRVQVGGGGGDDDAVALAHGQQQMAVAVGRHRVGAGDGHFGRGGRVGVAEADADDIADDDRQMVGPGGGYRQAEVVIAGDIHPRRNHRGNGGGAGGGKLAGGVADGAEMHGEVVGGHGGGVRRGRDHLPPLPCQQAEILFQRVFPGGARDGGGQRV